MHRLCARVLRCLATCTDAISVHASSIRHFFLTNLAHHALFRPILNASRNLSSGWPALFQDFEMHPYRSHTCAALRKSDVGATVRLSRLGPPRPRPWRLFCSSTFVITTALRRLLPIRTARIQDRRNGSRRVGHRIDRLGQGPYRRDRQQEYADRRIELYAKEIEVLSAAKELPLPVFGEPEYPEDVRLKYRFLDLRRETLHKNIVKRTQIIASMRAGMNSAVSRSIPHRSSRLPRRKVHATSWCRAAFILASSSPSAGTAAVQAASHGVAGFDRYFPDRSLLP